MTLRWRLMQTVTNELLLMALLLAVVIVSRWL